MMNWTAQFLPGWAQLEWSHPWWVLLALQPVVMTLLLKLRRNQVMHYADANLLAWVVRGSLGGGRNGWRKLMNFIAWLLLACALAGPRLPLISNHEQAATPRHDIDVKVILDVSPSMQAQDISPQRLQRAKLELLDLLPRLHGERVGLIAFSGSAGLIMPLSRDYAALRYYLQIAEPALFDVAGTALASALDLALHKLAADTSRKHAILLLTDAEASALSGPAGAAVWEAADRLKAADVRLYILGVGTAQGSTIPQDNGSNIVDEGVDVVSRLDQTGFTELAKKTNGKFALVADGDGDWRSLYDDGLLSLPGNQQHAENVHAWQELYASFLLPALLLFFLIHFPLKLGLLLSRLMGLMLVMVLAHAGVPDVYAAEAEAYAAYRSHNHTLAQTLYADVAGYSARMGEGAAAYRRKDYQYAIKQFSTALLESHSSRQREQALFNLGNSYFMVMGYRAAADAFLGVLHYAPDNQDARANLALAAGKLDETGKQGKKSQGVLGRRGRETGGAMGDDANDKALSMEPDDNKKDRMLRQDSSLADGEQAKLSSGKAQAAGLASSVQADDDVVYRVALKKLELNADLAAAMHKSLIRIEAAREYVPQLEMSPW